MHSDIKAVYDSLKSSLEDSFPHEMSSLQEFTAGMFSNETFEQAVANLVNSKVTFWDKLVNFFRNLFSLDSSYDSLINKLINIVDVTDDVYEGSETLEAKYVYGNSHTIKSRKKLESLNDTIENTLDDLSNVTKRSSENSKFKAVFAEVKEQFKELLKKYEKDSNEYKVESIKILNKFISSQLNSAEARLSDINNFNNSLYEQLKTYASTFNALETTIKKSLEELKKEKGISDEDYNTLFNQTNSLVNKSNNIQKILLEYAKNEMLNKNDLFSDQYKEVYLQYENKYRQEGKKKGFTKDALDEYVNKQLSENRKKIQAESKEEFNDLISSSIVDISQISSIVNSEKDFTHPIIRVVSRVLDGVKNAYQSIIQPKMLEIQSKTDIFLEGSRLKSSDENYKNLVEYSKKDEAFLKGEYQIGFKDSFQEMIEQVKSLKIEDEILLKQAEDKIYRKWFKENTTKDSLNNTIPLSKWKTDRSKLTQKEKDYLDYTLSVAKDSNANYNIEAKSLKKTLLGVDYYQLPSQHKEMITHIKNLGIIKYGKEMFDDTFKLRQDDTSYGEEMSKRDGKTEYMVYTDISGKEIKYVPIHHRGKIEKSKQSIDLATMYAVEYQSSVKFKEKTKVISELKMFIDVISENKFTKVKGVGLRAIVGAKGVKVEYSKENANILNLLETMMNNRIYDKTKEYVGKIGPVDIAKIESFIRGVTSRAGMALNVIGAPVNLITGKTQTLLENLRDPNLNLSNIKKAESFFRKNLGVTIDDLGRNVYKSLPNQMLFQFGGIMGADILQNSFEKNKALSLTGTKGLYMFQEGGEHWIQSVHTMSILDAAKILDEKGNYLDKNGKISSKKDAASILDISVLENGNLTTTIKTPFYTTLDRMKTYNNGGNATIRSYIQTSLIKAQGNYSQEYQAEMQRHLLGTMLMHFKKHIISPGLSKFRGFGTNVFADPKDISLQFDSDLQRVDEGNYTTWSRYLLKSFIPKVKSLQFKLMTEEWNEMDDWEKGNIKKTMVEIAYVALVATSALLFAGAAPDDDDYDSLWYAAAITRRLQSDALQYVDVTEAWRLLKNPISSITFLERTTHVVGSLTNYITPFMDDRNETTFNAVAALGKLVPGKALITNPKTTYNFSNRKN